MISPSSSLPFFLFTFLFLFLSIHSQPLIHSTCKYCSQQDPIVNYQFCATSLEAAYGSHHADIRSLGKISIHLTRKNLTNTRSHIKKLLKNNGVELNSYVKMRLEDCLELYTDSIIDIKSVMKSYNSKRYTEASILISGVMDAATTCENGFKEEHHHMKLLTKRNDVTCELSAIGLSIIRILQSGVNLR